jgi:hypothetical protein
MKPIAIAICSLVLALPSLAQSNKSKPATNAKPTRTETVQWLNSKMADKPSSPINDNGTVNRVIESISPDGRIYNQDLIIYKSFSEVFKEKPKLDNRNITVCWLMDLNPGSLTVRHYKNVFYISASTTNSLKKVKVSFPGQYADEPEYEYTTRHLTSVEFGPFETDQTNNFEERVVRALKHLITLNGGKGEAF